MANNKIIFGNDVLIDLTSDTVDAAHLLSGKTAHDRSGAIITGTCTYDADTTDATAVAGEILASKTAYVNGAKVTGEMPNRGSVTGTISTVSQEYGINNGYHDGSGKVSIDATEQSKIIPGNIKSGVQILGVEGTYAGEAISAQSKNATPYLTSQTILPDTGYDYLSQVVIAAISRVDTPNAAGGMTVTIGEVAPA